VPETEETPPSPSNPAPDDTDAAPPSSGPASSAPGSPPTTSAADPDTGSTSSGDELFPELGSADLDVQSYDVRLGYDPGDAVLSGTVTITLLVARPLDEIALDATDLVVGSVTVDGVAAPFEQTAAELLIRPVTTVQPGVPVVVAVTYRDDQHAAQSFGDTGSGWYPTPTGSYVLNEPDGARSWLPSNDHPSDKATWHFEVTVPAGVTAVANGQLVGQRPAGDGTTWVWEQSEPMTTYLVQLLTGDYEILDGGLAGAVPLTNVALSDDVERMQGYFDETADQIAYFETLFGPYPLDRYGLAFSESAGGLAMETQGRSLFSRDDFPAGSVGFVQQLLLSHELAHQWFGDAVSPAEWSDLWLNESFATYGQWLWLDHIGLLDIDDEAQRNLDQRQLPTEPTGTPSLGDLFGYERYDGGAVVLHALRAELGDDEFFPLLQRWVADNDGTSRTSADFIALAEEVSGRTLQGFFDDWLYAAGLPAEFPS
jgi:aminopeptidase N